MWLRRHFGLEKMSLHSKCQKGVVPRRCAQLLDKFEANGVVFPIVPGPTGPTAAPAAAAARKAAAQAPRAMASGASSVASSRRTVASASSASLPELDMCELDNDMELLGEELERRAAAAAARRAEQARQRADKVAEAIQKRHLQRKMRAAPAPAAPAAVVRRPRHQHGLPMYTPTTRKATDVPPRARPGKIPRHHLHMPGRAGTPPKPRAAAGDADAGAQHAPLSQPRPIPQRSMSVRLPSAGGFMDDPLTAPAGPLYLDMLGMPERAVTPSYNVGRDDLSLTVSAAAPTSRIGDASPTVMVCRPEHNIAFDSAADWTPASFAVGTPASTVDNMVQNPLPAIQDGAYLALGCLGVKDEALAEAADEQDAGSGERLRRNSLDNLSLSDDDMDDLTLLDDPFNPFTLWVSRRCLWRAPPPIACVLPTCVLTRPPPVCFTVQIDTAGAGKLASGAGGCADDVSMAGSDDEGAALDAALGGADDALHAHELVNDSFFGAAVDVALLR